MPVVPADVALDRPDPGADVAPPTPAQPTAAPRRGPLDRPVLTTVVLAVLSSAYQLRWVAIHRHVGGFGVDETAYLTTALRLERRPGILPPDGLFGGMLQVPRLGPLVPTLSALAMRAGGRSVTVAMVVPVVLYASTAIGLAAMVARLSTTRAALVAGIVSLGLPINLILSRSYQFASGVTAFLVLAAWALVASERGTRAWPMVGFGAAVGAMLLSRTMVLSFLPAIAVAVAFLVHKTWTSVRNLAFAALAALAVAGPWWISQWHSIWSYLFSFGYGKGTSEIDSVSPALRVPVRLGLMMIEARPLLLYPALALVVAASVDLVRWRRRNGRWRGWQGADREIVALVIIVAGGMAALLSSSNLGNWFQSPLVVLSIAPIAAVSGRIAAGWQRAMGKVVVAAAAVYLCLLSMWAPLGPHVGDAGLQLALLAGTEGGQALDFDRSDPRFAAGARWEERRAAERDWAQLAASLGEVLRGYGDASGRPIVTFLGEASILNANTLAFQGELHPDLRFATESPEAPEAMIEHRTMLEATVGGRRRVIVSVQPADARVLGGADAKDALARARASGWVVDRSLPMPDGGRILVLTHRSHQR